MRHRSLSVCTLLAFLSVASGAWAQDSLIAVEENTGNFYSVSTSDASIQLIGSTGIPNLGSLEFNANDGFFYGFTGGEDATLYRFAIPATLDSVTATPIGELGLGFVFEGAIAFAPNGTAYAMNGGSTLPALLTLNLTTGAATVVGVMSNRHDIAGLGWRSDGVLIGLDSTDNALLTINPANAATATIDDVAPIIGTVGGMALINDELGYFVTAGPMAINPGSNDLYSFNPVTGQHFFIGTFDDIILGSGLSGLTVVPEPTTAVLVLLAGLPLVRRRRSGPR